MLLFVRVQTERICFREIPICSFFVKWSITDECGKAYCRYKGPSEPFRFGRSCLCYCFTNTQLSDRCFFKYYLFFLITRQGFRDQYCSTVNIKRNCIIQRVSPLQPKQFGLFYDASSVFRPGALWEKAIDSVSLSGMPSSPIWDTVIWSPSFKERSVPFMALTEINSVFTGSPLIQIRLYGVKQSPNT